MCNSSNTFMTLDNVITVSDWFHEKKKKKNDFGLLQLSARIVEVVLFRKSSHKMNFFFSKIIYEAHLIL